MTFCRFDVIINLKGGEKMEKYYQKNILKCVFSALVIFLWGFTVKGIAPPEYFTPAQKTAYYSLPLPKQQELMNFLNSLKNDPMYDTNMRNKRIENFDNIICAINNFLNSQENPQTKQKMAVIIGLVLFNNGEIAVNTRHLKSTTGKCKSSLNAGFQLLGYDISTRIDGNSMRVEIPLIEESEIRRWSLRRKSSSPNPPTVNPNSEDQNQFGWPNLLLTVSTISSTVNPNSEDQNPFGWPNLFGEPNPLLTVNPNSDDQNPSEEPDPSGEPDPSWKLDLSWEPNPFEDQNLFGKPDPILGF
ncbi:MAG: hypothetical protein LBR79_01150 [Oscillospiraceae bacterium]|nr:hypothetical protein [Oscillospiraceae bacterium]